MRTLRWLIVRPQSPRTGSGNGMLVARPSLPEHRNGTPGRQRPSPPGYLPGFHLRVKRIGAGPWRLFANRLARRWGQPEKASGLRDRSPASERDFLHPRPARPCGGNRMCGSLQPPRLRQDATATFQLARGPQQLRLANLNVVEQCRLQAAHEGAYNTGGPTAKTGPPWVVGASNAYRSVFSSI